MRVLGAGEIKAVLGTASASARTRPANAFDPAPTCVVKRRVFVHVLELQIRALVHEQFDHFQLTARRRDV